MQEKIIVLDFGGQYKELIARSVRSLGVYSEIKKGGLSAEQIKKINPVGIIMTGGPNSVYLDDSPTCDREIFSLGIPVLGICYGMQLMCHLLGGEVVNSSNGEYGETVVTPVHNSKLFDTNKSFTALMSHRDCVKKLPNGFIKTAETKDCIAAFENTERRLYGVQFHPETEHTENGKEILHSFLYNICKANGDYKPLDQIDTLVAKIREKTQDKQVLLALSGGVDSSVCAALLSEAIPNQVVCIFVDHGFMRLDEGDEIERIFSERKLKFIRINAQERFLSKLSGVCEPEQKRKIIGEEFVRVFEEESHKLGVIPFLAQGTIYPDIVESDGIKSHHNVGGLPTDQNFELIEPLSGFFKDEVREIGLKLGLPDFLVNRQPFPGPGLAVRIIGDVTKEKLDILRRADYIFRHELETANIKPSQYFAVLTDTLSVGVKGDKRTYDPVIALRAVNTEDFMTCDYAPLPHEILKKVSARITSEIPTVSRIVYDVTAKPPGTVEWE